ncbi:MAG: hypothetical protein COB17_03175 [Sulfurimonas sp.]|nr:MAG: hypothetical protein COB17_03175 [Sulfurimonas sp.]
MNTLIRAQNLSLLFVQKDNSSNTKLLKELGSCFKKIIKVQTIADSIQSFQDRHFDILVLDYHIDNSYDLILYIRKTKNQIPIILLSDELSKNDLLKLLTKHISAYINKSLQTNEIITLLHNIMIQHFTMLEKIDNSFYCSGTKKLIFKKKSIKLSNHESIFLELLLSRRGYIVYYSEIEYEVWKNDYMSQDAIKSLVKKLRQKLPLKQLINVVSKGYKLL